MILLNKNVILYAQKYSTNVDFLKPRNDFCYEIEIIRENREKEIE